MVLRKFQLSILPLHHPQGSEIPNLSFPLHVPPSLKVTSFRTTIFQRILVVKIVYEHTNHESNGCTRNVRRQAIPSWCQVPCKSRIHHPSLNPYQEVSSSHRYSFCSKYLRSQFFCCFLPIQSDYLLVALMTGISQLQANTSYYASNVHMTHQDKKEANKAQSIHHHTIEFPQRGLLFLGRHCWHSINIHLRKSPSFRIAIKEEKINEKSKVSQQVAQHRNQEGAPCILKGDAVPKNQGGHLYKYNPSILSNI